MAFIDTTPPHLADQAVADLYRRQQAAWGYVPNYARVFCHRPEVMARWGQLLAEIRRPMDTRRFELVTFAAAHELRHSACALAHGNSLRAYFTDEEIISIAQGRLGGVLDDAEQAMVVFARRVARDASLVEEAEVAALVALGFTAAEIFDIAAAVAGRAFFTKLLDALGVQANAPLADLDQPLLGALTVGRPIDKSRCECVPVEPVGFASA
jgi:alkylhydroperoxidase family enzyme